MIGDEGDGGERRWFRMIEVDQMLRVFKESDERHFIGLILIDFGLMGFLLTECCNFLFIYNQKTGLNCGFSVKLIFTPKP